MTRRAPVLVGCLLFVGLFDVFILALAVAGRVVGVADLEDTLVALDAVEVVQVGFLLVTAVLFAWWLYDVAFDVRELRPDALRRSPRWAAWGWVVPIANVFVPKQMVDDVWKGLSRHRADYGTPGLIPLWWGLWLSSLGMDRLVNVRVGQAVGVADVRGLMPLYGLSALVDLAAALAAALLVWRLHARYVEATAPVPG